MRSGGEPNARFVVESLSEMSAVAAWDQEGLASFAARFVSGLVELEGVPVRVPVIEQVVGLDERGRLRRQTLLHEPPVARSERIAVNVLLPGPGLYEVRNALHSWNGRSLLVGLAFVYVAAHGARVFERSEVEAVARTLDSPRRPGRPRSWLKRRPTATGSVDTATPFPAPEDGLRDSAAAGAVRFADLEVGDVVALGSARWGHGVGSLAVCYETFDLADRPGRAFVFSDGLTVGCDESEYGRLFRFVRHEATLAAIRVRSPRELALAVAEGRFAVAFAVETVQRATQ